MKRKAPVLLCLLFLTVLSLAGFALAEEPVCMHDSGEIVYKYQDADMHAEYCGVCGEYLGVYVHVGICGSDDSTCIHCGGENVNISTHEKHPINSEVYDYEDEECHRAYCSVCGDDMGLSLHVADCLYDDTCIYCGERDVIFAYSDHVFHLVGFDRDSCYYACNCGEISYDVWHGIYCDSEDKNTCVECGKNTEADGIKISDVFHDTVCGYDEKYCWTVCPNCGYMPYFAEHYTGCVDDDDTRCDNCGRTEDDGIIIVWKHGVLDSDGWYDDDKGVNMHRQVCRDCGYEGEEHVDAGPVFSPIEGNIVSHLASCEGCDFTWTESHIGECGGDPDTCAVCGAENVQITQHSNHPEGSESYVCADEYGHNVYCSVCGEYWGQNEHVADCSDPERCKFCGEEGVIAESVEHNTQLIDFDEEHCYYSCACGEEAYDWLHVVYCDSDQGACVGCGKSVEVDGIVISVIWHHDHVDYNESECWDICDNCGELYRTEHYFSCTDEEQMYCSHCEASREEVFIDNIRHDDIDMNDYGDGWHNPVCNSCGELLGEPHKYNLFYTYGGYEHCKVYCDVCGYLTDWGHQGQCGEPRAHTYCINCGAVDVAVDYFGNHLGPTAVESIDESYHQFYCGTCGETHYAEEHKSAVGSYDEFGTCAVCGAEDVLLYGPVTFEERIEDGMRLCISYNEDGSKHIDFFDAENGDFYGWEIYEYWEDEQPADWERRSNLCYDEYAGVLVCNVDSSRCSGVFTYRLPDGNVIGRLGFDGEFYFEESLNEGEGIWYCAYYADEEHNRIMHYYEMNAETDEWIVEKCYDYDVMDIPGAMHVVTKEHGIEVMNQFFTDPNDEEPVIWEHYYNTVIESGELPEGGHYDMYREFSNSEGENGIEYYRDNGENGWFLSRENRYYGNGSGYVETIWDENEEVYYENRFENERPIYSNRLTADWQMVSSKSWEYFESIDPVITERSWREDGTAYEKIYTNPNDSSTYEEHTTADGISYNWRSFSFKGVARTDEGNRLKLPEAIKVIGSEAFAGVPGWIVILHPGVTSIAPDAFSSDTVMLVPNEAIAKLAQDAGYVWYFNR